MRRHPQFAGDLSEVVWRQMRPSRQQLLQQGRSAPGFAFIARLADELDEQRMRREQHQQAAWQQGPCVDQILAKVPQRIKSLIKVRYVAPYLGFGRANRHRVSHESVEPGLALAGIVDHSQSPPR
jgi:hypothetical protein